MNHPDRGPVVSLRSTLRLPSGTPPGCRKGTENLCYLWLLLFNVFSKQAHLLSRHLRSL